jgi:hypothetical protein
MVNQKLPDLGIPNRFNLSSSRFRRSVSAMRSTITFTMSPDFTTSRGILDEGLRHRRNVQQPVLMHADIDEGAERRDVGYPPEQVMEECVRRNQILRLVVMPVVSSGDSCRQYPEFCFFLELFSVRARPVRHQNQDRDR